MAKNTNPQTAGRGQFGALTQAIPWLWGIDVLVEVVREFKGKTAEETKIDDVVFMVLKVGLLLLVSPFGLAFVIPAGLAWKLGFGNPIKIGVFAEITLAVFIIYLAWKKLNRDPWSRALMQAKLEYQSDPKAKPGDLAKRVRDALGQDSRAAAKADDAVRSVFGREHPDWVGGGKLHLRIGRKPSEETRRRGRSSFHFDRSLRKRLPRRILSDLLPKRKSRRDDGWDFL